MRNVAIEVCSPKTTRQKVITGGSVDQTVTIRRISQPARNVSAQRRRSKAAGFFATQTANAGRVSAGNKDGLVSPSNNQQSSVPKFARAVSNGRRSVTNSRPRPAALVTVGRNATSSVISSYQRRSLSVSHARGREERLETRSPSRLSKIMSQKEIGMDAKDYTSQARKASISSMRNTSNRLIARKASM